MKRRRLILRRDVVRLLAPLELGQAVAGVMCTDTCGICDTIKPAPGCA